MTGCSGTGARIVTEFDAVWPKYAARVARLPWRGVLQSIFAVGRRDTLVLETDDGLLIVQLTPSGNELELHVMLAVSNGTPGAFRRQESAVCAIARDLGASAVTFTPARRGWGRLVGPQWIARGTEYVRQADVR